MFGPLSAFPVTPLDDGRVDARGVHTLVSRAVRGGADSVGALGSTGGYPYLSRADRRRVAELSVEAAGPVPVLVGVGALSTREVLEHVEDAQAAGVAGVLLAPLSYQPLTDDEVFALYEDVTGELSVPLCVYDNPTTTRFRFGDELLGRVAALPHVVSVKIPGVPGDPAQAAERVARLRAVLPAGVSVGVSGDVHAVTGLRAGCDLWYSVLAGALPGRCRAVVDALAAGDGHRARELSDQLLPLWDLFAGYGGLRIVSAVVEVLGYVPTATPPRPLLPLPEAARRQVQEALALVSASGPLA
ncbi:dihydrodipicolinate synthase family protein [Kineococcus sp. R86509]|uniref:dihydrodipicolinate synthase family protein n=1 Tax=Kineococcus sp. R86509 TaxID=3093851 RepID=UPI0036D3DA52